MSEIIVYDSEQVTVKVYPDLKIVHHIMHKYTHGEDLRAAMTAGVEAMEKYHADKWLSDDRENPVLHPDDQQWSKDVWQDKVFKAGWKYWALVQPQHSLAKMRMINFVDLYSARGLTVELFDDPDKAMEWLKNSH